MQTDKYLLPEGVYKAKLTQVRAFSSVYGNRVGLVYRVINGPHEGAQLMESAMVSTAPRSKLVRFMRGMGGGDGQPAELVGKVCRINVKHEVGKSGKIYAAITDTFM